MGKFKTQEEFIADARKVHGDKYDYSHVEYAKSKTKVAITCRLHKVFYQTPNCHLRGQGCPECGRETATAANSSTREVFIAKALTVHGDQYDYSSVEYINSGNKVKIICKKHGLFTQSPSSHIAGIGCKKCGIERSGGQRKHSQEDFNKKAKEVHGNRYDYTQSIYKGSNNKIKITCKAHGIFNQRAIDHLRGQGCPQCRGADCATKLKDFVDKATQLHGEKYNYKLVNYQLSRLKVKILCPEHGIFKQTPNTHLRGSGCPGCSQNKEHTTESFINKASTTHRNRYDYSLVDYKGAASKVKIICPEHGVFTKNAAQHLYGSGCPNCALKDRRIGIDDFITRAREAHGDKYDYSRAVYKRSDLKLKIICPEHGAFQQEPYSHIRGVGCPKCKYSKGEIATANALNNLGVRFEVQKRFDGCRYKNPLPFDFYLPNYKMLIEYDGEQHFRAVDCFGGEKTLKATKKRDKIKDTFAKKHNYRLLRIPYTDYDRIEEILQTALGEKSEAIKAGEQLALFF